MKRTLLLLLAILMLTLGLVACAKKPASSDTATTAPSGVRHTVAFGGPGIDMPSVQVADGTPVSKPTDPVREGYIFLGWYGSDGTPYDFATPVVGNLLLTARWSGKSYTLVFYGPNGDALEVVEQEYGTPVEFPRVPLSSTQFLEGWYTEANGGGDKVEENATVSGNAFYYAYAVQGVTLSFYDDTALLRQDVLRAGEKVTAPTAPDKSAENKEFLGWYTADDEKFSAATAYTASTAFYAKYVQYFNILFVEGGATVSQLRIKEGYAIVAPTPGTSPEGKTFVGWLDGNGRAWRSGDVATADVTYTATFLGTFTVTFKDPSGQTIGEPQTVREGESATLPTSNEYFYEFSPSDALLNIRENKEITLIPVSKTVYDPLTIGLTTANTVNLELIEFKGSMRAYATVLYQPGDFISYTGNLMGPVTGYINLNSAVVSGQEIHVTVYLDGVAVNYMRFTRDDFKAGIYTWCHVNTPGVHTVRLEVTDMVGFEKYESYIGLEPTTLNLFGYAGNRPSAFDFMAADTSVAPGTVMHQIAEGSYAIMGDPTPLNAELAEELGLDEGTPVYAIRVKAPTLVSVDEAIYTLICYTDGEPTVLAAEFPLLWEGGYATIILPASAPTHRYELTVDLDGPGDFYLEGEFVFATSDSTVTYTVTFEGEGVSEPAQTVSAGSKATRPATDPTKTNFDFVGWTLNGQLYDFDAPVGADITLVALFKESNCTVTFKDEAGNTIATQEVVYGGCATLPTAAGVYYTFSPADALYNITQSKTVVLTAVAAGGYTPIEINTNTNGIKDYADMLSYTVGIGGGGMYFYKDGVSLTMTVSGGGEISTWGIWAGVTDATMTLEVLIDGRVVNEVKLASNARGNITFCYLPDAEEHTVEIRVKESAGLNGNSWHGFQITVLRINLKN